MNRSATRAVQGMVAAAVLAAAIILPGRTDRAAADDRPTVVTTTAVLADLSRHVAGEHARVVGLVPPGADPHSYEPSLRDVRDIVHADLGLSNYLMLEEHSLIQTLDANLPADAPNIALAEAANSYGAEVIPLVENHALDTVWLGLRVQAEKQREASRDATVSLAMTGAETPEGGSVHAFVTGTFGQPTRVFDSSDGFDDADLIELPLNAHTHLSWAFTAPGWYRLHMHVTGPDGSQRDGTVLVAVGVDPSTAGRPHVLAEGHVDITANEDDGAIQFLADAASLGRTPGPGVPPSDMIDVDDAVISVPTKALLPAPSDPAYRFVAKPGTDVYQLPQAVLGNHVHGEIDPHLWLDVRNVQAYVQVIRDQLIHLDPAHADAYRANAADYSHQLDELHRYVTDSIATIPESRRQLITTTDAYGYLAHRYGMQIAAVVSPSPGKEPSLADRRRLTRTLTDLTIPAVFLEPTTQQNSGVLIDAAHSTGARTCPIWGDSFSEGVTDYMTMMRADADSLARCLGGRPLGNHDQP